MLGSLFDNRLIVTHNSCCALYWYTLTTMQGIELSHPSIDLPWMYQSDLFFGVYFATTWFIGRIVFLFLLSIHPKFMFNPITWSFVQFDWFSINLQESQDFFHKYFHAVAGICQPWWLRDNIGNPFLLVKTTLVGYKCLHRRIFVRYKMLLTKTLPSFPLWSVFKISRRPSVFIALDEPSWFFEGTVMGLGHIPFI